MYFDSLEALLHMNGHGTYVWSVYLIATLVVTLLVVIPIKRKRRALQTLAPEITRSPEERH